MKRIGKRFLSYQQEIGCQDSEITSANRMERQHQRRLKEKCQGEKNVQTNSSQPEDLARFRNVRSKPEQVAASDKDVESKKRQGQTLPRDSRASQGVRRCSYRLSLVFTGSSLSRNFRHPACPGSTCKMTSP